MLCISMARRTCNATILETAAETRYWGLRFVELCATRGRFRSSETDPTVMAKN